MKPLVDKIGDRQRLYLNRRYKRKHLSLMTNEIREGSWVTWLISRIRGEAFEMIREQTAYEEWNKMGKKDWVVKDDK